MSKETKFRLEQAARSLLDAAERYARLDEVKVKLDLYTKAFDRGSVSITPIPYDVDRDAGQWEVYLTREEMDMIRESVLRRISLDAERRKKQLENFADKVEALLYGEENNQ